MLNFSAAYVKSAPRYAAMLLVGHLGKKGGKSQYRGLGSIDIFAAARSVMTVGRFDADENMRAMVHNKSNLASAGVPQAFGLDPINGFCWLGECDTSIDELLNGKKGNKPENQFVKASWLIEKSLMNSTAVAAADIIQAAEEQGISEKTLKRAKSELGVISVKKNGRWFWQMPIEVEFTDCNPKNEECQESQEGHVSSVTSLSLLKFESEAV